MDDSAQNSPRKINELAFSKAPSGKTLVSFQLLDGEGTNYSLDVGAKMLPWDQYKDLPEPMVFTPNAWFQIGSNMDVQLRVVADNAGEWKIEMMHVPTEAKKHVTEEAALRSIVNHMSEAGFIDYQDTIKLLKAVSEHSAVATAGPAAGHSAGKHSGGK